MRRVVPLLSALLACEGGADSVDTAPDTVPWSRSLPPLADDVATFRDLVPLRAIIHLHSPYSHDACDGEGYVDGVVDTECLAALRLGLCETAIDVAFVTDHPAYAADQTYEDLLFRQPGDADLLAGSAVVGNAIACDDGHTVAWLPGIEDELMPVALDRHAGVDAHDSDRLYNAATGESIEAERLAGGTVLMAHTEAHDKELAWLEGLQDEGLQGVEVFNLHAMFAPDKRQQDLGLDPLGYLGEIAPFTRSDTTATPDLLILGVLADQPPSFEKWDGLLARGPMVGVAGSDSHQNVLPLILRDGDRGDSHWRTFRWFANVILSDSADFQDAQAALAAGRVYASFHILGTPDGFDFHLEDAQGVVHEMGSDAPAGTLHVGCPGLSPSSPRGRREPEVTVTVLKDGAPWKTGCGAFPTDGPGVYRARADIVPHHLEPFLGDDPAPWLHAYPWVIGNAIRVEL